MNMADPDIFIPEDKLKIGPSLLIINIFLTLIIIVNLSYVHFLMQIYL
jgi:hypothetical protein